MAAGVIGAFCALSVIPGTGSADTVDYSRRTIDCNSGISDPVGALFEGSAAGVSNVASQIRRRDHGNWPFESGTGTQGMYVHDNDSPGHFCRANEDAPTQGGTTKSHIRLWKSNAPNVPIKTAGTPHREDLVSCGHAVISNQETGGESGFDIARRDLRDEFRQAGHVASDVYVGNTQAIQQCDGEYASSNGNRAIITISHVH